MSGNVDDCFRVGIALAKKSLKLYASFDTADILICSPLGLRMIVGDEEKNSKRDYDFLASIEVLIVDKVVWIVEWFSFWKTLNNSAVFFRLSVA